MSLHLNLNYSLINLQELLCYCSSLLVLWLGISVLWDSQRRITGHWEKSEKWCGTEVQYTEKSRKRGPCVNLVLFISLQQYFKSVIRRQIQFEYIRVQKSQ